MSLTLARFCVGCNIWTYALTSECIIYGYINVSLILANLNLNISLIIALILANLNLILAKPNLTEIIMYVHLVDHKLYIHRVLFFKRIL